MQRKRYLQAAASRPVGSGNVCGGFAMPEAVSKICVKCGTDCAGKPRTKDSKGRYMCRPCADAVEQARAEPAPGEDDGAISVEGIDASAIGSILAAESSVKAAPRVVVIDAAEVPGGDEACPACGAGMRAGAMKCKACGFDRRAGLEGGKGKVGTTGKCSGCGYDLKGIKAARCPECGKILPPPMTSREASRREHLEKDSKTAARNMYLRPIVLILVGLSGLSTFILAGGHNAGLAMWFGSRAPAMSTQQGFIAYFLDYGLTVVAAYAVYWVMCVMWIGFDEAQHVIFLKIMGALAISKALLALYGLIPPFSIYLRYFVPIAIYCLPYYSELEMDDWREASLLAVLTLILAFGIKLMLVNLLV